MQRHCGAAGRCNPQRGRAARDRRLPVCRQHGGDRQWQCAVHQRRSPRGVVGRALLLFRELQNCTFSENHAKDDGGAFNSQAGWKSFINCTFSGNRTDGASGNWGGALYLNTATNHWFDHCTIVTNRGSTGGIYVNDTNNNVRLYSTIIAHNVDVPTGAIGDLQGTIREMDYCLVTEAAAGYTLADATPVGNLANGTNPKLGPLADNGGPALPGGFALLTHALAADSPALDQGWNRLALATDQRGPGNPRESPVGEPDIGAFEYVAPPPGETLLMVR